MSLVFTGFEGLELEVGSLLAVPALGSYPGPHFVA